MIRTEEIRRLSPEILAALTENSRRECEGFDGELPGTVYAIYDDNELLLVLGVERVGLLLPAQLMLLVGTAYGPRYAKQSYRMVRALAHQYNGLRTLVSAGFVKGCRFAEFFGFKARPKPIKFNGKSYFLYEVYP